MLTKIKNFVKKAFKKVKEVIDRVKDSVIDIAKEAIKSLDNPVGKEFVKRSIVPLVGTIGFLLLNAYTCMNNAEEIEKKYYESAIRRHEYKMNYLKAIDIQ